MPKTRTLDDLYRVQREVTIGEGAVDPDTGATLPPVTVLVRKLSKPDTEVVLRHAGAARALFLAKSRDADSLEYQQALADVWDMGDNRAAIIDVLIADDELDTTLSAQAELEMGDDSEWGKDGYLQGLTDSWRQGLSDTYAENPEDPDASRVLEELKRYSEQVQAAVAAWRADEHAKRADQPLDDLRAELVRKVVERRAEDEWSREQAVCTVWRAVRLPGNPRAYYFQGDDGLDRVRDLADEVFDVLHETYLQLSVGVLEGKDSPGTPASSPSSEQPEPEATGESSGLAAVSA